MLNVCTIVVGGDLHGKMFRSTNKINFLNMVYVKFKPER